MYSPGAIATPLGLAEAGSAATDRGNTTVPVPNEEKNRWSAWIWILLHQLGVCTRAIDGGMAEDLAN